MHKVWFTHTIEYHSAMKRREAMALTTMWMNPEHMLRERSQTHRATQYVIPFM